MDVNSTNKGIKVYSNDELLNFGNLGISECFKIQNEKFNKFIQKQ